MSAMDKIAAIPKPAVTMARARIQNPIPRAAANPNPMPFPQRQRAGTDPSPRSYVQNQTWAPGVGGWKASNTSMLTKHSQIRAATPRPVAVAARPIPRPLDPGAAWEVTSPPPTQSQIDAIN